MIDTIMAAVKSAIQLIEHLIELAGDDADKIRQQVLTNPTINPKAADDAWDRGEEMMP